MVTNISTHISLVVYLVAEFANRRKAGEKFVTLVRRKEGIQVTFDVSSGMSSVGSAKHRELIVAAQLWKSLWCFCYVVIVIAIALCCPLIVFAACMPSIEDRGHQGQPVASSSDRE